MGAFLFAQPVSLKPQSHPEGWPYVAIIIAVATKPFCFSYPFQV